MDFLKVTLQQALRLLDLVALVGAVYRHDRDLQAHVDLVLACLAFLARILRFFIRVHR